MTRPALWLLLLAGTAAARPDPKLEAKLAGQKADFAKAQAGVRGKVVAALDRAEAAVRATPGLTNDDKAGRLDRIKAARRSVADGGKFPADVLSVDDRIAHAQLLNRAYLPAAKTVDALIGEALSANDDQRLGRFRQEKQELDALLPGRDDLSRPGRWEGAVKGARAAAVGSCVLRVVKVDGSSFAGVVEMNPGTPGHPVFEVAGRVDGNGVALTTGAVRQGRNRVGRIDGYLLGDGDLVLVYEGVAAKDGGGVAAGAGQVVLRRKGR